MARIVPNVTQQTVYSITSPAIKAGLFVLHKSGAKQKEANMEATYFIHIAWLIIKIIAATYSESKNENNKAEEETT